MENYRIKDKKEYFKCSYNQIINTVASCVQFYENRSIDITPDAQLSRINNENIFDKDKPMIVKFISGDTGCIDELSDNDSEYSESDDDIEIQKGGNKEEFYDKYVKYHLKYLELKFDCM